MRPRSCRSRSPACRSCRCSISAPRWGERAPFWDSRDEFGDTNLLVVKPEEGASLARALGSHSVVLMRRHGATVVGGNLRELVFRTIYSAKNAEHQLAAHVLGHVSPLTDGEAEMAGSSISRPGRSRAPMNTGCGDWRSGKGAANLIRCCAPREAAARLPAPAKAAKQDERAGRRRKAPRGEETMSIAEDRRRADRARVRRDAGCRAGHAEDRDRADQQLGEPGADARRGRRHLQEAQSEDRSLRHAGRGRDHPGGDLGLGRSRRRRRRRRRDARVLSAARRCACCCRPSPAPAISTGT